ncbi:hypothetical protein JTE90_003574 [Oedothorax gibbosus]|uniref:Cytokine receptor n=1 Tax=Oedothorax gibbosus TaxID=931172 RepID=A0AAV6VID4_9ARAC|nr:hypothetical protein JTE90_003574 [Oedothorax gibbosus]
MKLSDSSFDILLFISIISIFIYSVSTTCISTIHPYGDSTQDYNIQVGGNLIVDCILNEGPLPDIEIPVNSSYLAFKKDGHDPFLTENTVTVNSRKARLTIPNARVEDSGVYYCLILLPKENKPVCLTEINVGYPPQNVSNFKCISRNLDNLTCTWDVKPNPIRTNYTLKKLLFNSANYAQDCPQRNYSTFCQWRDDTDPPYDKMPGNKTFVVTGNNSLGSIENVFILDHYELVIPNSPENLSGDEIGKNYISVRWEPPTMTPVVTKPVLYYQLWLQELRSTKEDKIVVEAGTETFSYTFDNLIPYYMYNISVRCRVNYTEKEDMWSTIVSQIFRTKADVPYSIPEVNSQAFVIHNYGIYRNTTLYWKPISKRSYNGEDFHYHIVYYQNNHPKTSSQSVKSKTPHVQVGHLHNNTAYTLHIHSANSEGISQGFQTIVIDERDKILPSVKDIRAISNGIGHYNLSWSKASSSYPVNYTVFWCEGRKPGQCDGPIQWREKTVEDTSFSLVVADVNSNFQFAIATGQNNRSSGMQWASCIVPRKAPLGQIPITHIEPFPHALEVRWKLDCEAQKSVIDRYVITFCKEGKHCSEAVSTSDSLSYMLDNLHPYSNYSIKLRAFNKENKPSEDTDEMYQQTSSTKPADPPRNLNIFSTTKSSFIISWLPPLKPNGIITDYCIYINEARSCMTHGHCQNCKFQVNNLKEYTSYNVSVEACVRGDCSRSLPVSVMTDVGVPGKMHPPLIEKINTTHLKLSWSDPFLTNGPIDTFEIQWLQVDSENKTLYRFFISRSAIIKVECPNVLEGGMTYQFSVRAANAKDDGTMLFGPFSEPAKETTCVMSQGLAMIIGVAIGGTFASAIFLLLLYKLIKWMIEKIHQVKNIAVRLPKELEGPETNPLNNYDRSFKNGLVQGIQNGKPNLSLELDDNKNRHGSGSSQFSHTSTDELIFKNGKCTKFGRKPSGDSSGCSSMTSNATTRLQLSSDSGTESDFNVPSSPDSISNEQKTHMPILMEIRDAPETSGGKSGVVFNGPIDKYNGFMSGMVLKVEHPYSKFGINGSVTSSKPCQINPLVLYSCNLANSEPSVFEAQAYNAINPSRPLYSKVGFAKSSGDILSINKEMGYSKFGLNDQDGFSIDGDIMNSVVGNAVYTDNAHQYQFVSKSMPNFRKRMNSSMYPIDCKDSRNGESRGCVEIPLSNRPFTGYVQVGDIRNMAKVEADNLSLSTCSIEEDSSPLQIPENLVDELSDVSSVWTTGLFKHPPIDIAEDAYSPTKSGHHQNGGLTLPSSLSPSSGCVYVHPSSSTDNGFRVSVKEDNHNPSNFQNIETSVVGQRPERQSDLTRPPEVLLNPVNVRNGYVPFSAMSSLCVPNPPVTVPLSIFPGDISTDQNYITPSNKGDMKLLQKGLMPGTRPVSHSTGSKIHQISSPIKHILKPLPKMESEICEV